MKIRIYYCFLFCCLHYFAFTQTNKDYILTLQQDTLFGKIQVELGREPISFKYKKLNLAYHPSTIKSFGIFREKQYRKFKTLKSPSGKTAFFVEIVAEGNTNLYKFDDKYIMNDKKLRYIYFMENEADELSPISSSTYQRRLARMLKDYPHLLSVLEQSTFAQVPQLIKQYNDGMLLTDGKTKESNRIRD